MSQFIKNINKILRCEVSSDFTFIPKNIKHSSKVISDRSIKFSPCAKKQLINWVIKNANYYPLGYTNTLDYGLLTKVGRNIFNLTKFREEIS
jgi:hypothetical protein